MTARKGRPFGVSLLGWLFLAPLPALVAQGLLTGSMRGQPPATAAGQILSFVINAVCGCGSFASAFVVIVKKFQEPSAKISNLYFLVFFVVVVWGILMGRRILKGERGIWRIAQAWLAVLTLLGIGLFVNYAVVSSAVVKTSILMQTAALIFLRTAFLMYLRGPKARAYFGVPARAGRPPVSWEDKCPRLLANIDRLFSRGKTDKALSLCREIIGKLAGVGKPSPEQARYLGLAYLKQGRIQEGKNREKAVESYHAARRLIPLPAPAVFSLAAWHAAQKDPSEDAIGFYLDYLRIRRGLRTSDPDPVHLLLRELCTVEEGAPPERVEQALSLSRRILERDGKLDWAQYHLGMALAARREYAEAVALLEKAVALNPAHTEAAYFAALYGTFLCRGEDGPGKAVELCRKALSLIEDRPEAHIFLAKALIGQCEELEKEDFSEAPPEIARLAESALESGRRAVVLNPEAADAHYCVGRSLSYAGNGLEAVKEYRKAVSIDGAVKEYHLHLAAELSRLGNPDEALRAAVRAIELDPAYADAHQVRGDILTTGRDYGQAVVSYQAALVADSGHRHARLGLGRAFYHLGQYSEAIQQLEPLHSRSREAGYLLARCCSLTGQFSRAVPLLESLTARPDASADSFYFLGCAQANLGRFSEAVEALSSCLGRDASHWRAFLQRGHCHMASGLAEKAAEDYRTASSMQAGEPEVMLARARCHLIQKETATARELLEELLRSSPSHFEANMLLGALAEEDSDRARAENAYLAALEARPDQAGPSARLGLLRCHEARYREAAGDLERAAESDRENDGVLYHLGLSRAVCGDCAGALKAWSRLRERHPKDRHLALEIEDLYYLGGRRDAEAGNLEQAIGAWEELLRLRPEDPQLRKDLAELHFRQGVGRMAAGVDREQGRKSLEAAVRLNPDHAFAPFYLALADLADGRPAGAIERLQSLPNSHSPELRLRALYHQGLAHLQMGRETLAIEAIEAVAGDPLHNRLQLPVNWTLAVAHARTGAWEKALHVLNIDRQPL